MHHHDTSLTIPAVGITILVFNTQGHVMLAKRLQEHGHGQHGAPGGGLGYGETPPQAAHRKTHEKAHIKISTPQFLCLTNFIVNGHHYLDIAFTTITKDTPQNVQPDTHSPWEWHPTDQLPTPLFTPTESALNSYKTGQMYNW